jgi:hypothetical protein
MAKDSFLNTGVDSKHNREHGISKSSTGIKIKRHITMERNKNYVLLQLGKSYQHKNHELTGDTLTK